MLDRLPESALEPSHFTHRHGPVPTPGPGEALVRTVLLSVDPANRAWMNGPTYRPQLVAGDVMAAYALAEVVDPGKSALAPGSVVFCDTGWQEYAAIPAATAMPVPIQTALTHHLSTLGLTGMTAYFGLLEIGAPAPGETVVVSAAAGATGNVVGQIARIKGARVVGISSSDAKRRMLEDELGFDATVSHRSPTFKEDLAAACPDGIDVYFDNVGGDILNFCMRLLNERGRVVCCGGLSSYDQPAPPVDAAMVPLKIVTHRLRMEGFIVLDYMSEWPAAGAEMAAWIDSGELRVLEDVIDGLEQAPTALIGLLAGENLGKRMVRVGPDPVPV
ncbi:NADP-dependent oxidoreductase [Paraconexibacter sp. AEG42_29]|uniref:NADP-dependent oxidoreductase n=1 Tax=Paraconexibacter sp. AEG42_29 TaxID=2997339 RepID=UPI00339D857C